MFDQVKLSKNGWHFKLQKYTFGHVPYQNNFCPFFWLTIFCVMSVPFVWSFKSTKMIGAGLLNGFFNFMEGGVNLLGNAIDNLLIAPIVQKTVKQLSDNDVIEMLSLMYYDPWDRWQNDSKKVCTNSMSHDFDKLPKRQKKRLTRVFNEWRTNTEKSDGDWQARIRELRTRNIEEDKEARRLLDIEHAKQRRLALATWEADKKEKQRLRLERHKLALVKQEARELAERKRRAFYAKLAEYTKYIVILPMVGLAGGALYVTGTAIAFLAAHAGVIASAVWFGVVVTAQWLVWVAPYAGWTLLGAGGVGLVGWGVYLAGSQVVEGIRDSDIQINIKIPDALKPRTPKFITAGTQSIGNGFKRIGTGIKNTSEFGTMYVRAFRENNCPAIEWEEEEQ